MDRDKRTRLWARDTRGLQVMAGLVGAMAVAVAVYQWVMLASLWSSMSVMPRASLPMAVAMGRHW